VVHGGDSTAIGARHTREQTSSRATARARPARQAEHGSRRAASVFRDRTSRPTPGHRGFSRAPSCITATALRAAPGTCVAEQSGMNHRITFLLASLAAACTASPAPGGPVALHSPPTGPVDGNHFECTGQWPSSWTPCGYDWPSTPMTTADADEPGVVRLGLERTPIPTDGGASVVYIDLAFDADDHVTTTAWEHTTSRTGNGAPFETSDPVDGWVEPVVTSPDPNLRNAGRFSVTFAWGSIEGTYDTAPLARTAR
jgi:hypothetical protein